MLFSDAARYFHFFEDPCRVLIPAPLAKQVVDIVELFEGLVKWRCKVRSRSLGLGVELGYKIVDILFAFGGHPGLDTMQSRFLGSSFTQFTVFRLCAS